MGRKNCLFYFMYIFYYYTFKFVNKRKFLKNIISKKNRKKLRKVYSLKFRGKIPFQATDEGFVARWKMIVEFSALFLISN